MFDKAAFEIIGRVGNVKVFDKVVRVSIASNASYKKNGEWVDRTDWNEVAIFDQGSRNWVEKNLTKGDYVRAVGNLRQNSFERNGEKVYTVELDVTEISRQPKKAAADKE